MPLNTRIGRCVTKLRNKYGYGKAIGIRQHSTKQNYLTGKTIKKKQKQTRRKRRRNKKTKRAGMRTLPTLRLKTHMGKRYVMKVNTNNQPILNSKGMIDLYDYKKSIESPHMLRRIKSIPSYKNPQEGSGKKTRRRRRRK